MSKAISNTSPLTNRCSCQKWGLDYSAAAKEFMLKLYFTRDSIVWDAALDSRS